MGLSNQHEGSCELLKNQQILVESALFKGLTPALIKVLAYLGERKLYTVNQLILTAGEPAEHAVIIIQGDARLELDSLVVSIHGPGSTLGGMAMFGRFNWLYSLRALQDVETLLIPRRKILPQLIAQPDGLAAIARELVNSVVEREKKLLQKPGDRGVVGVGMI